MLLRGELWWADLDPVVGRELGRKVRPVLVVSNDEVNTGPSEKVIVVPSTTQSHDNPAHVPLVLRTPQGPRTSYVCCEDVRSVSLQRLMGRIGPGPVPGGVMSRVEQALRVLLDL